MSVARNEDIYDNNETDALPINNEAVVNTVRVILVGTVNWDPCAEKNYFSRALVNVPEIGAECYVLRDKQLENFMNLLATEGVGEHSLEIGRYSIDAPAIACRILINSPDEKPLSATIDFWTNWQEKADTPDFKTAVENMRRQRRFNL